MNPTVVLTRYLQNRTYRRYLAKLEDATTPYAHWIKENEKDRELVSGSFFEFFTFSEFANRIRKKDMHFDKELVCVCAADGEVSLPDRKWLPVLEEKAGMAYGDEDLCESETGKRYGPWFKPDESSDTLLSFFYFGSLLLLRTACLKSFIGLFQPSLDAQTCSDRALLYDFVLGLYEDLKKNGFEICHIPEILFHGKGEHYEEENPEKPEVVNRKAYWGYEAEYDAVKLAAAKRRLSNRADEDDFAKRLSPMIREQKRDSGRYSILSYEFLNEEPLVSVIIPSKDHPKLLRRAMESFVRLTTYSNYEFIIVDNGSADSNRAQTEQLLQEIEQTGHRTSYCYQPMEFNFSVMCNIGASKAQGEFLLFLNDDIEIVDSAWLSVLCAQAACPWIGAVGAKLLYPNSDLIQHVGISSILIGPAHKLLKESDKPDYYYGRNVLPYDMVGVTAACLIVAREKFEKIGGFPEEIAVSYNDVALNFALLEAGFYNVIRNDIICLHHESLSRGDDTLDDAKWDRLLHEKALLYQMHPRFAGFDPYYSVHLAGFKHKYFCSYLYPYERRDCYCRVRRFRKKIKPEWYNDCLIFNPEHSRIERKIVLEEEAVYWIEGWSYVLGMDNSRYRRMLILTNESGESFEVGIWERYRQDVVSILPEQTNVALAGFSARIRRKDLPSGTYRLAMLCLDQCSRQKLYREWDEPVILETFMD